jgi:hypothetical protein
MLFRCRETRLPTPTVLGSVLIVTPCFSLRYVWRVKRWSQMGHENNCLWLSEAEILVLISGKSAAFSPVVSPRWNIFPCTP